MSKKYSGLAEEIAFTIAGRLVLSVFWSIVLNPGVTGIAWAIKKGR